MMTSFVDASQTCPPNLHLVLSKTCLEFDKNGVHVLVCIWDGPIDYFNDSSNQIFSLSLKLSLVDELYGIDSATLTHETFICTEMRESAQVLLDSYVRLQGLHISQVHTTTMIVVAKGIR